MERLEHCHRVALRRQQICVDQARRPGTDNRHRGVGSLLPRIGETSKTHGIALGMDKFFPLRQKPLELADRDWSLQQAHALALQLLRTHSAGDIRQRVAGFQQFQSFGELAGADAFQDLRNVNLHRATACRFAMIGEEHPQFAGPFLTLLVPQHL